MIARDSRGFAAARRAKMRRTCAEPVEMVPSALIEFCEREGVVKIGLEMREWLDDTCAAWSSLTHVLAVQTTVRAYAISIHFTKRGGPDHLSAALAGRMRSAPARPARRAAD